MAGEDGAVLLTLPEKLWAAALLERDADNHERVRRLRYVGRFPSRRSMWRRQTYLSVLHMRLLQPLRYACSVTQLDDCFAFQHFRHALSRLRRFASKHATPALQKRLSHREAR